MKFTYDWYFSLIDRLRKNGYEISSYSDASNNKRNVILRHDVDFSLEKAVEFANAECQHSITSTYFVLLSSDFYNVFSISGRNNLKEILKCRHKIGLHYDETAYGEGTDHIEKIIDECSVLSETVGEKIDLVSMHRPSRKMLDSDIRINGIINSYSSYFFREYKYFSDSRMRWREDVDTAVELQSYEHLHILTHPFWYFENERNMEDIINEFIYNASDERYREMKDNITDIDSILMK